MATTLRNEFVPGWSADDPSLERLDVDLLARAYRFSATAHEGQFRKNGDPFVTHCVEVARILAELQLDSITVAAGLSSGGAVDNAAAGAAGGEGTAGVSTSSAVSDRNADISDGNSVMSNDDGRLTIRGNSARGAGSGV